MARNSPYYKQVQLLLRVLPFVNEEACFALKGGPPASQRLVRCDVA